MPVADEVVEVEELGSDSQGRHNVAIVLAGLRTLFPSSAECSRRYGDHDLGGSHSILWGLSSWDLFSSEVATLGTSHAAPHKGFAILLQ